MKHTYCMRTDIIFDEDGKEFTVFGIDVKDSSGRIIKSVPDIFFDKKKAVDFISLCNTSELSIIHLMDVIEDVLC